MAPRTRASNGGSRRRVTLPHLIRSEAIKLTTLRSPWWSAAIVIVSTVAIAALYTSDMAGLGAELETPDNLVFARGAVMPAMFTVLLASMIGTMLVTGEYSTGMIRSTLTAAPDRIRSLIAKVVVAALFVLTVSLTTSLISVIVASFIGKDAGIVIDFSQPETAILPYVNGAVYLALVSALGVGVGYCMRNATGAIAVVVTIIFVIPMIPGVIPSLQDVDWVSEFMRMLPMTAGNDFMLGDATARLHGGLVLVGWAVVSCVLGAISLAKRDA
ncbi:ABC transporter permease subunit [Microbacterium gorillae]|uniref:ABC transporter permease subunit n=1 Tax=Microbacterium gorillae TaxID=1231063 RepID=UPI000693BCC1|nr:ABC transporter permease subunit [Microbacterium gorillae]